MTEVISNTQWIAPYDFEGMATDDAESAETGGFSLLLSLARGMKRNLSIPAL
jgi:hypothetical protein